MFLLWVEKKLIPAFRAKYPGRKMVLVMDNAPYHSGRDEGWKSPAVMKREELLAVCQKWGIESIDVVRKGERRQRGKAELPSAVHRSARKSLTQKPDTRTKEIQASVRRHLRAHPELKPNRTADMLKAEGGWTVLNTPPLEPECQPIELLWGVVKGQVAASYFRGRMMKETREQLMDAFYHHPYPSLPPPRKRMKVEETGKEEKREDREKQEEDLVNDGGLGCGPVTVDA